MASSSSDIGDSLDELTCPVCFELYNEPTALPCGHSFCLVCIERSWESREEDTGCVCPNCREVFPQKPKLKKNVTIANLVENIKLKKREVGLRVEDRDAEHGGVKVKEGVKSGGTDSYCEVCNREAAKRCVPCEILCCVQHLKPHQQKGHKLVGPGVKIEELRVEDRDAEHGGVKVKEGVKSGGTDSYCEVCNGEAAKRCVPCEILCCVQHLKPHQQKGHKLVGPGVNIEELRCIDHEKPIQLYCKDDGSLMCVMCMGEQHQNHKIVAVETAHTELKDVLAAKCPDVSQSIQSVESQLHQVHEEEEQTEQSGRDAEDMLEEKRRRVCQFVNESVDLMKSQINKRKMEKLSLLGKQREKLEQQMESLHQGKSMMQTAFQDLEAVSFLQGYKDLLKRLETVSDFKPVKTTPLTVLDFSKEEKNLDVLIELNENFLEKIQKGPMEEDLLVVELDRNNLRSLYGRSPSLDPNSTYPQIKISRNLRTATRTRTEQPYPQHPDRFDIYQQVVSSESFSSGRHYWEVDVRSSILCRIGICLNSMRRKRGGRESLLGGNPQSWCLYKYNNEYSAYHNNQDTPLSVSGDPERFGFFLDYEAGELTCFEDSRVLHMFRGNFMDPVKPAIGVYGPVGDSVRFL